MENENKDTINKPNNINGENTAGVHTHTHRHIYQSFGRLIKCIIFFIIGLFIFETLTHIFVPKWVFPTDPATPRIKGFYSEKSNTIDVLVIGASDVGRGYSPVTVWNKYGITSYNLGTSNQTMSLAYYLLKESLNYQNPNVVVLDMDALFVDYDAPEGEYRKLFDNMKLGKVKLEAINDKNVRISDKDKLSYIFPLLRFHDKWDKLGKIDFKKSIKEESKAISYKGMAMSCDIKPYIDNNKYMSEKGEIATITEENLYYVDKIVKLCEENSIKMLWTEIPSTTSWSLARNKTTQELANKYNIEFIDYNLESIRNELKFDWTKHTADQGNHLNVNGAEKISKHIGKVLSEKYNCKSHKKDKKISKNWNKEAKRYKENKKKLENTKK